MNELHILHKNQLFKIEKYTYVTVLMSRLPRLKIMKAQAIN